MDVLHSINFSRSQAQNPLKNRTHCMCWRLKPWSLMLTYALGAGRGVVRISLDAGGFESEQNDHLGASDQSGGCRFQNRMRAFAKGPARPSSSGAGIPERVGATPCDITQSLDVFCLRLSHLFAYVQHGPDGRPARFLSHKLISDTQMHFCYISTSDDHVQLGTQGQKGT